MLTVTGEENPEIFRALPHQFAKAIALRGNQKTIYQADDSNGVAEQVIVEFCYKNEAIVEKVKQKS